MKNICGVLNGFVVLGFLVLVSGCGGGNDTSAPPVTNLSHTGTAWQWVNPTPTGNTLLASADNSASGLTVAVGQRGTLLTSTDRSTWTVRESTTQADLNAVLALGGSAMVAVGAAGTIISSSDGILWRTVTSGVTTDLNGLTWDGTDIVAVGDNGTIVTSPDGVDWTVQPTAPAFGNFTAVVGNGSFFVVVDDQGHIATSPNLVSWAQEPSPVTSALLAIAWRANRFLAVGAVGVILTSTDGVNWTERTSGVSASLTGVGGVSGGPLVVVGRYSTASNEVLTSADSGVTWTRGTTNWDARLTGLADDGTSLLATGFGGTLLVSANGTLWTPALPTTSQATGRLEDVAWSGSQFIAVGRIHDSSGQSAVLTSPDGVLWTTHGSDNAPVDAVIWDGAQFVGVAGGQVMTSATGANWSMTVINAATNFKAITHDISQYVAVGIGGAIYTSVDGTTWAAEISGATSGLIAIASSGARLVVVGENGTLLVQSGLGLAWIAPTVVGLGTTSLFDVEWNGVRFVAVGDRGTVVTSTDGIAWALAQIPEANRLRGVNWDGGQFVVVSDPGHAYTSGDGLTWTARDAGTGNTLTAVAGGAEVAVAVGWDGTIIRSVSTP